MAGQTAPTEHEVQAKVQDGADAPLPKGAAADQRSDAVLLVAGTCVTTATAPIDNVELAIAIKTCACGGLRFAPYRQSGGNSGARPTLDPSNGRHDVVATHSRPCRAAVLLAAVSRHRRGHNCH